MRFCSSQMRIPIQTTLGRFVATCSGVTDAKQVLANRGGRVDSFTILSHLKLRPIFGTYLQEGDIRRKIEPGVPGI